MDGYFYSEHNFSMISYCWKPHLEYHKSAGTSKEFIDGVTKLPVQGVNFNAFFIQIGCLHRLNGNK